MAVVIHTIKGNDYAYDHHREGEKVVSTYIGPVGGKSKGSDSTGGYSIREPMHGGGAPKKDESNKKQDAPEVTQHSNIDTINVTDSVEIKAEKVMFDTQDFQYGSGEAVVYDVYKSGQKFEKPYDFEENMVPKGHPVLNDSEYESTDKALRSYSKNQGVIGPTGSVRSYQKSTIPDSFEARKITYAKGDSYAVKDELKAAGMKWNPTLKMWESQKPIHEKVSGIEFETVLTYKTKNSWTWYD